VGTTGFYSHSSFYSFVFTLLHHLTQPPDNLLDVVSTLRRLGSDTNDTAISIKNHTIEGTPKSSGTRDYNKRVSISHTSKSRRFFRRQVRFTLLPRLPLTPYVNRANTIRYSSDDQPLSKGYQPTIIDTGPLLTYTPFFDTGPSDYRYKGIILSTTIHLISYLNSTHFTTLFHNPTRPRRYAG